MTVGELKKLLESVDDEMYVRVDTPCGRMEVFSVFENVDFCPRNDERLVSRQLFLECS